MIIKDREKTVLEPKDPVVSSWCPSSQNEEMKGL